MIGGGLVCGVVQAVSVMFAVLTTARDETSTRAAAAVSALGDERWQFALHVTFLLTFVGTAIGATQALIRWVFFENGAPRHRFLRDVLWSGVLTFVLVLGRSSAAPALVSPSLPLPASVTGWLAVHVSPAFFYSLPIVAAVTAAARAWRRRQRARSLGLATVLVGAPVLLLMVTSCKPGRPTRTPSSQPNVLVLAADSIRPDHIKHFGYPRDTTPNIDRLISEGAVFERAIAPMAMTTPSWVSILTGRYPHSHGVRHMFPDRRLRPRSLDTLPRAAQEKGYRTAVLSDYAGDFFPIFDFGFEETKTSPPLNARTVFQREVLLHSPLALALLEPMPSSIRPLTFRYLPNGADAERLADEVIDEIDGSTLRDARDRDKPFFIVAFFSTTHVPFASRHPYNLRFTKHDYTGEHRFSYNLSSIADIARAEAPISEADAQHLIALYDGALLSVDAAVGRVLNALSARDLDRDTIVVFLSDHGENLFEPGQTTLHGKWFRGGDEANRVPLIVRGPSIKSASFAEPVSLIDLAPTLGDLLALRPLDRADGRSLAKVLRGEAPLDRKIVFAETGAWLNGAPDKDSIATPRLVDLLELDPKDDGQVILKPQHEDLVITAKHRALWDGALKLNYEPGSDGVRFSLFDLSRDPTQQHNLAPEHPMTNVLIQRMFEWLRKDPERELDAKGRLIRRGG